MERKRDASARACGGGAATTAGRRGWSLGAHGAGQRGSNENVNGPTRDYFPKGTALSAPSAQELVRVDDEVNDRPRKTLGWNPPADLLAHAIQAA